MAATSHLGLLKKYYRTNLTSYLLGGLAVLFTNLAQVSSTRLLGVIIDTFQGAELPHVLVFGQSKEEQFLFLFWLMFFCYFSLMLGRMGWRFILARQTHHASAFLRKKIWQHARFFPSEKLQERWTKGVLMNATNSDVNSGRFLFGFTLVATFDFLFLSILSLMAMFFIHIQLTFIIIGVLLFLPFLVRWLSEKEVKNYEASQNALGEFNDLASQAIATIRMQRMTHTERFWEKKLTDEASLYRGRRLQALFSSLNFIPGMGSGSIVSYLALFGLGITYVFNGEMSIGDFVAMQGLAYLLQGPLLELGFIISDYRKGSTSLKRLNEIYSEDQASFLTSPGQLDTREPIQGEVLIRVKDLSFQFSGSEEPLFNQLSFELRAGERLGIKGPIGSGKSVLMRILAGLERDHKGEIHFLDGKFHQYSHPDLRSLLTMVPQGSFLFASSIKQNIELDSPMSDDECWKVVKLAGLEEDVKKFPKGLETQLGEWGINLSGGQKQRLTLARALAKNPNILFLDDCLSAVDTVTEELILSNLDKYLGETTLVWVAHRQSTLKYCDRILHLEEGRGRFILS